MTLSLDDLAPTVEEYQSLRRSVGWPAVNDLAVQRSLAHSLHLVSARNQRGELAGMGRVGGDGILYFYLQDLIVHEQHRHRGIGGAILTRLLDYVRSVAEEGAFVGLMAAKDSSPFYERFGFGARDESKPGMYLAAAPRGDASAAEEK